MGTCYAYMIFLTPWTLLFSQLKDDVKITQSRLNGRIMPLVTFPDLLVTFQLTKCLILRKLLSI